jgi:hypothetical protein
MQVGHGATYAVLLFGPVSAMSFFMPGLFYLWRADAEKAALDDRILVIRRFVKEDSFTVGRRTGQGAVVVPLLLAL